MYATTPMLEAGACWARPRQLVEAHHGGRGSPQAERLLLLLGYFTASLARSPPLFFARL